MLDGIFKNPTEIYFGPSCLEQLGSKISQTGERVLVVYGGKSAEQCGAYDDVISALKSEKIPYSELAGIKPNPTADKVREGIELCKRKKIDLILAVGGGSVIDTAKAISVGVHNNSGELFDLFDGAPLPEKALSVGVVLTLPGSGSESSPDAVISFPEFSEKRPITSHLLFPKFAFLNPNYTLHLSKELTMSGLWDAISHVLERYFTNETHVECSSHLSEGLIKALMSLALKLLEDPTNYGYRAEAMWACKLAHDGTIGFGRKADWSTHRIAHEIAAVYDTRHGNTLAVIFPSWIEYISKEAQHQQVSKLGTTLFGRHTLSGYKIAQKFRQFIESIGLDTSLNDLIGNTNFNPTQIAEKCIRRQKTNTIGNFKRLFAADIKKILQTKHY